MKNKRLIILISIFLLLAIAYLVQIFFFTDNGKDNNNKTNTVTTVNKNTIEEEVVQEEDQEKKLGYIKEIDDKKLDVRDPFSHNQTAEIEYEEREAEFLRNLNAMIISMEAEQKKSSKNSNDSETDLEEDYVVSPKDDSGKSNKTKYDSFIEDIGKKYNINPFWIKAIIQHESSFNAKAVNKNKNGTVDKGLMQINSDTAPWLAKELGLSYKKNMEFDPKINIEMGTAYMSYLRDIKNDMEFIFTAYNRGPKGAYNYKLKNGTYSTEYSKSIVSLINKYNK